MNRSPIDVARVAKGWAGSKEQEVWYKNEIADAIQGLAEYQQTMLNEIRQLRAEVRELKNR